MRFVIAPDGEVVFDVRNNLPGRGVWIERQRLKLQEAIKKKLFAKGFKQNVPSDQSLMEKVEDILLRDLRQSLSLANKAGMVVAGFMKVEAAIAGKNPAALIHACDGGDEGRRKIAAVLSKYSLSEGKRMIPVIDVLSGSELSLALGREHVIHAAVLAGKGSKGFLKCWDNLCDYHGSHSVEPQIEGTSS